MEKDVLTNSFALDIDHRLGICTIEGRGVVNFQQVMDILDQGKEIREMFPDYPVYADLRTVNYHPDFDEIMFIKNRIIRMKDQLKSKIALVSNGKIKILSDMISAFSIAFSIQMKSFSNEQSALHWLKIQK